MIHWSLVLISIATSDPRFDAVYLSLQKKQTSREKKMIYTFKPSLTTVLVVLYALALVAGSPLVCQYVGHRLESNAFEASC
jgi:hypothetical protein